jgi:phosphoribosylanthranilate isomerase
MVELDLLPSFIKICGITSVEDASFAVDAGATAIGLVFAQSPRKIDEVKGQEISGYAKDKILRVGVFKDQSDSEVLSFVRQVELDCVQLHSLFSAELASELRKLNVAVIKAMSVGTDEIEDFDEHRVNAVLIDGPAPGSGEEHSWADVQQNHFQRPMIAAGGLNSSNVLRIVSNTSAWGVDVSSGCESAPGKKDQLKVQEFVRKANKAFVQQEDFND